MGLLDDLSKREPRAETPEPPVVGHYGVKLELSEEKVSLTAGQTKEYPMVVTNSGTEDDTIRLKIDLVYNSELPDPPEWTVKLYGVEDKVWDVTFTKVTGKEFMLIADVQREILLTANIRGYVYVESMNPDRLEEIVRGLRRARGVVKGEGETTGISFSEIEAYLTPKPIVIGIMEGDIVELVAGPFKGEKARVMKIDETKEEITVELFEAMVRIPVTVRGDSVRVLQKEEDK